MDMNPIGDTASAALTPSGVWAADLAVARNLTAAVQGDARALFDLGVTFSTNGQGVTSDLIEAHKWFNLAAVAGHEYAKTCRADISEEMSPLEIAEAQRRARQWIARTGQHAVSGPHAPPSAR